MESKFKVGDRVKCVDGYAFKPYFGDGPYEELETGREYTVDGVSGSMVKIVGFGGGHSGHRFTLADPATDATPAPTAGATDGTFIASFVKHDAGKSRVDLIPPAVLEELGHVLRIGAEKYGEDNWARGANWRRYLGASLRHVYAFARGEDRDPESGYSHLAHAMACLCFLFEYVRCGLGKDDRWKGP